MARIEKDCGEYLGRTEYTWGKGGDSFMSLDKCSKVTREKQMSTTCGINSRSILKWHNGLLDSGAHSTILPL